MKKRIISLVLAFVLLLTNAPISAFSIDYTDDPVIGRTAKIISIFPVLWKDPTNNDPALQVSPTVGTYPTTVKIIGVHHYSATLTLYKLDTADGSPWPAEYKDYRWMESTKLQLLDEPTTPPETTEPTEPTEPTVPTEPTEPTQPSQPDEPTQPGQIVGGVHDENGDPVLDSNGNPLHITVSGDLPAGAYVSATVPMINGQILEGVYDIKVFDADGNEWQPIDYGKTVTVYLPVTDSTVEYVDIYHFIDYAPDINGDEEYASSGLLEFVNVDFLSACVEAYERACGTRDSFAYEKYAKLEKVNSHIAIDTDSFSVFYYDKGAYGNSDGNLKEDGDPDPINFFSGKDGGKTYFVTRGTVIYCYYPTTSSMSCNSSEFVQGSSNSHSAGQLTTFTVSDSAELYGSYTITAKTYVIGTKVTVTFVVMPELTVNFKCNLDVPGLTVTLPDKIDGIFMGNSNTHNPNANPPQYAALNYTFKAPTLNGEAKEAYTFRYWYVEHYPSKTFVAGQIEYLSNTTLEVDMQDSIDQYTVNLVAWYDLKQYNITYNLNGESVDTTGYPTTYTIEDILNMPTPTSSSKEFLYWQVTTDNGNWDKDDQILGGEHLSYMYGDVTLTAVWASIDDITYKVEHYVQDTSLSTDLNTYLLYDTDTMLGTAGEPTTAAPKNIVGFNAPAANTVVQQTINKDGTTVVKIYYTRKNVTITFDSTGGSDVASITRAYGTVVSAPTPPTKTGYVFMGWYTADAPTQIYTFTTMPAGNLTLYAKWEVKKVTITLRDAADNSIIGSINQDYDTTISLPSDPTKVGYVFDGWYMDKAGNDDNIPTVMPEEDTVIYAKFVQIKYVINFDTQGGSMVGDATTKLEFTFNNPPTEIPGATKAGHSFGGWYANAECTGDAYTLGTLASALMSETPSADNPVVSITVYAQWTPNSYTVTWKNWDGTVLETDENVPYGTMPQYNGATPTRPATAQYTYTFTGWNPEVSEVQGEVIYTAVFSETLRSYTVTFKDWDGTTLDTQTVEYGGEATAPADPTREGYTFTGWDVAFNDVKTDLVVTAQYSINTYTVTFKDWNGTVLKTQTVNHGGAATAPENPNRTGYTFTGWDVAFNDVKTDLVVTAQYSINTYTVTFNSNGGSGTMNSQSFTYGAAQNLKANAFTRTGYTFNGWNTKADGTGTTYDDEAVITVTSNLTLYAQWTINSYKLTINYVYAGGGTAAATHTETVTYGDTYSVPSPSITGYTPNVTVVSGTMGAGDVTVTVTYTANTYTLTIQYVYTNGTEAATTYTGSVAYGASYSVTSPTITGYTPNVAVVFGTMGAENVEVTVTYTINSYTVKFTPVIDVKNPSALADQNVKYNTQIVLPTPDPVDIGFQFTGWDVNGDDTADYDAGQTITVTGDITLKAIWDPKPIEVRYEFVFTNGATVPVTGFETHGDEYKTKLTLKSAPVLTGYQLTGMTVKTVGGADVTVTDGEIALPNENVVVTFTYAPKNYTVTWDVDGSKTEVTYAYGATIVLPTAPEKEGYTFDGWDGYTSGMTMPAENLTFTAQWKVNQYTISFDSNGGSAVASIKKDYGATVTKPGDPTLAGHTFGGWYTDETFQNAYTFDTMPAEDITLYAKWTVNNYTITWIVDGNTTTETYAYGATIVLPTAPTKEGYTFTGWSPAVPATMPAEELTFTAQWQINSYTLTIYYVYGGGGNAAATHTETVTYGQPYSVTSPTITGYTHNLAVVSGTMGAENVEVTVTYTATSHTVKWMVDGDVYATQIYAYGAIITPPTSPNKEGYTFNDWNGYTSNMTMPAEDLIITAQWTINSYTLTIHYVYENGTTAAATHTETVTYGQPYSVTSPTITGYTPNVAVVSGTMGAGDVTITVTYTINTYTVTFTGDLDNLVATGSGNYTYGEAVIISIKPNEGYVLSNLLLNGTSWGTFNPNGHTHTLNIESNVEIHVSTSLISYTITYNSNGGSTVGSQTYTVESEDFGLAAAPTRTGYTFTGWKLETGVGSWSANTYDAGMTIPTGNHGSITLVAQWTPITYTVIFDSNNGSGAMGSQSFTYNVAQNLRVNAFTRTGYTFAGWNTKADGTGTSYADKASVSNLASTNGATVTLYAQWTENTVDILFEAVGPDGKNFGSVTTSGGTYGVVNGLPSATATPEAPTFKFVGWFDNESCTGEPVSTSLTFSPAKGTDGLHQAATYYALFDYNLTSLEIKIEGCDTIDAAQGFICHLEGTDGKLDVAIKENGTVTIYGLTVGSTYTIELTDWSWRYDVDTCTYNSSAVTAANNTVTIEVAVDGTLVITVDRNKDQWLDGNDWLDNWLNGN